MWGFQLLSNNSAHFSAPRTTEKPTTNKKHADTIQVLQQYVILLSFQDFRKQVANFSFLSALLDVNVETVPDEFQIKITELQCDENLQSQF